MASFASTQPDTTRDGYDHDHDYVTACQILADAVSPHRVGKPLFGPLADCHGARRGTYRIVYRIDEDNPAVHVLDIDHRTEIYRPHS